MKVNLSSFKFKLSLSFLFTLLISFGLAAYLLDKNLEEDSLAKIKDSLIHQADLITLQIPREGLRRQDSATLYSVIQNLKDKIPARITIINRQGKVLADSQIPEAEIVKVENHAQRTEIAAALSGAVGSETRFSFTLKTDMLYVAIPLREKEEIVGALRMAVTLSSLQETLLAIRKAIVFSFCFALGLAFLLGSLLAKGLLKPINRIIFALRKFQAADFSHRINLNSKDEIGELAQTLNQMAAGLEEKMGELELKNQHLLAILESMVEGIIVVNEARQIISLNPAAEKIFSLSQKAGEGKLFLEVIRNHELAEIINQVLKKGALVSREHSLVWPVQKTFQINAVPIFERAKVAGCLLVIHDITEIRRLETMRRDFVANVSHELKTPLTSIKGFVETLLEAAWEDRENSRNFLKIIQEHTNRLDLLVDDLLNLAHLESKEASLEKEEFNLKNLLEDIFASFKMQLKKKEISLKNDIAPDLRISADKEKIGQVLSNLIDNAIKFNQDKGIIKISVENLNSKLKIIVEDTGIGIPAKDLSRIFERFYRVDKARSRELGGTGLGLSIVKHIVELHGGSVGVESSEGLGAKFWFILPK
jgi:two-component system phosphate regulon sensor histidine kinase PhoR